MEKSLETAALELIRDRYQDEQGKRFIMHLISAFVCNEVTDYCKENMKSFDDRCCITGVHLTPKDMEESEDCYYGKISSKSDKFLSQDAYRSLRKFVELMIGMKDKNMMKISKYIVEEKKEVPKPKSKNEAPKEKEFKESRARYEDIQAII